MAASILIREPLNLFTGGQGAGKTLFAIEQADLLQQESPDVAKIYQLNIRKPDLRYLPLLPFGVDELLFADDGVTPIRDEQGNHLPKWSRLPVGSIIIIDEAHKVFPQRGPGRPPRYIEAMAESRYEGIRWLLLTQAPGSLDSFLRDRINRHFHIERKGGLNAATLYEFENRVVNKEMMSQQKRYADQKHVRRYPKKYYTWYESAKSHFFKVRIPLKIWLALAFIPVAGYIAYQAFAKVGTVFDSAEVAEAAPDETGMFPDAPRSSSSPRQNRSVETSSVETYVDQFKPLAPYLPWSAPAYQGREVLARPEVFCVEGGAGVDALGDYQSPSCTCLTEQGTPSVQEPAQCRTYARNGVYNPFKGPGRGDEDDRERSESSSSSSDRSSSRPGVASVLISGDPAAVVQASSDVLPLE